MESLLVKINFDTFLQMLHNLTKCNGELLNTQLKKKDVLFLITVNHQKIDRNQEMKAFTGIMYVCNFIE